MQILLVHCLVHHNARLNPEKWCSFLCTENIQRAAHAMKTRCTSDTSFGTYIRYTYAQLLDKEFLAVNVYKHAGISFL